MCSAANGCVTSAILTLFSGIKRAEIVVLLGTIGTSLQLLSCAIMPSGNIEFGKSGAETSKTELNYLFQSLATFQSYCLHTNKTKIKL